MFFNNLQQQVNTIIRKRTEGIQRRRHNNGMTQGGNQGWNQSSQWNQQQPTFNSSQGHHHHHHNNQWNQQQNNNNWNQNNQGWENQNQGGWGNQNQNQGGWGNQNNQDWGNQNQGGQQNQGWGGNNNSFGWNPNSQQHGNHLDGLDWIFEQNKRKGQIQHNVNMNDISNYINQQVVFVEPSPAKQKLDELKKTGQTFKDDRFPPNQKSLTGQFGYVDEWKQITWEKISQKLPNTPIFTGKIQPADIKQGYLGDCYLLAGIAALAQRPDRIFKLFLLNQENEQRYYSVKLLYKGKWITIDMDEYVPFLYGQPAFSKAVQGQLWVILLEKAWAKMFTNYKRTQAGFAQEGLHDLTGAPVRQISLQQAGFDKNKEWAYLLQASKYEYSMCASSQPGSDTTKSASGVVNGHAYTFLQAVQLNVQGQVNRLVQLRNPWGKGQSKGKWSDQDPNWNYVSEADKKRLGYVDKDDGIFYMSYDDFCHQFRAITVAQIDDNSSYIYKSVKDPQCSGCYFKVKIHKQGNYSFHIDKTPDRAYQDSVQQTFQYPIADFEIGRVNQQKFDSFSSGKRTLYKSVDLQPGEYTVFARIKYDPQLQKDFDVNLAVYAEFPCQITLASHQEAVALSGNQGVKWTGQEQQVKEPWHNLSNYGGNGGNNINNNNNNNSGWGNQGGNNNNSGWGNQGGNNNVWENQGGNSNNNDVIDDGWGGNNNNNVNQGGNGNSWGNQGNNNSGWQNNNNTNNGWSNSNNNSNNGW